MNRTCRNDLHTLLASLLLIGSVSLSGCAGSEAPGASSPATTSGFTHLRSLGGIDEYRLEANGLTVLLYPQPDAPVVAFQVTYGVGSRNEVTGTTGATHLLEHLMFKGSDAYNDDKGNSVKQYLDRAGASYNATTSLDYTNYYATLRREDLEGYIAIEADRMRNLWLRESDRAREMTVVRNEYERGENRPDNVLAKEVLAATFIAHPYHHMTIGWRSDIENVTQEKLREFYDTFYWSDNATVTVVGDFEPAQVLTQVRKYYGGLPRAPRPIHAIYTVEPEQSGERRVTVKRPGQLGHLLVAHKIVPAQHADFAALDVLGAILSIGKNSRLYRALVDTNFATSVEAGPWGLHDPGPFFSSAALAPGVSARRAEEILLDELQRIRNQGVTGEEVGRAVRQYRVQEAFGRDGPGAIARALNYWISVGDWTLYVNHAQRINAVTPADVQRVARTYLGPDQSTTGWFIPVTASRE